MNFRKSILTFTMMLASGTTVAETNTYQSTPEDTAKVNALADAEAFAAVVKAAREWEATNSGTGQARRTAASAVTR